LEHEDAGITTNNGSKTMTMNPKTILIVIAILLAACSYAGWPTLGAAVIILAVANFVP
jgi:hypothetical protein